MSRRLGVGSAEPKLIFVGEAFDEEASKKLEPFQGKPGELFDNALRSALGLPWKTPREEVRKDFYITNLVNERPSSGSNDIAPYFDAKARKLTPLGEEAAAGLVEELANFGPASVVPLGGTAYTAVTGDSSLSITKARGTVIPRLHGGFIVPALHPAGILRSGDFMERRILARDIEKALKLAEGKIRPLERNFEIDPEFPRVIEYLRFLRTVDSYSFDIETPGGQILCIGFADSVTHAVSINLGDYRWTLEQEREIWKELKATLEAPGPRKITQNGNFDSFWLRYWHDIRIPLETLEDTMVLHHIAQPDLKKSLAMLTSLFTCERYYKDDGDNARLVGDLHAYMLYNAKDAVITFEVWQGISRWRKNGIGETYDRTMKLLPDIQEMQNNGFEVDQARYEAIRKENKADQCAVLRDLHAEVEPWILDVAERFGKSFEELQEEVSRGNALLEAASAEVRRERDEAHERVAAERKLAKKEGRELPPWPKVADRPLPKADARLAAARKELSSARKALLDFLLDPVNVESAPQMQDLFYRFYKQKPFRNRKTKEITLDDDALASLARGSVKQPPIRAAILVRRLRGLQQEADTFLAWATCDDGRYRCEYHPRGTAFGRFSSSRLFFRYGTNGQNMPPRIRSILRADSPDEDFWYFLATNDKRGIEWVMVAYLSGDEKMIEALSFPGGVHVRTAMLMASTSAELIGWENKTLGKETSAERIRAGREARWMDFANLAVLPSSMTLRQMGKKANHALNYGEGEGVYSLTNEISIPEARKQIARYHAAYPGVKRWHQEIAFKLQSARAKGQIPMLEPQPGVVIPFHGDVYNGQYLKSAFAAQPQRMTVDSINPAMRRIRLEMPTVQLRAQTHDDLTWQARVSRRANLKDEAARLCQEFTQISEWMTPEIRIGKYTFTVPNDLKLGRNWGDPTKDNPLGQAETALSVEAIYKRLQEMEP